MGLRDRGLEIKSPEQVDLMRKAGLVVGETLELMRASARAGVSTAELDAIAEDDASNGFLLDGYPRTLAQVEELDAMVGAREERIDAVVVLTVEMDEIVQRLLQRAQTEGRADDTEEVIRRRQEVYAEQTEPLIEVYRERGLLVEVDGMGEVAEVTRRVLEALDSSPRG